MEESLNTSIHILNGSKYTLNKFFIQLENVEHKGWSGINSFLVPALYFSSHIQQCLP